MTKTINELVTEYLEFKAITWSPTTIKSETARLNALIPLIEKHGMAAPHKILEDLFLKNKPHTIKITMTRLSDFEAWGISYGHLTGPAIMPEFIRRCARRFQGSYRKERLEITIADARKRLAGIDDPKVRRHAEAILRGGLRFAESVSVRTDPKGFSAVVGKGGILRRVFNVTATDLCFDGPYHVFYKALKQVGLKPHTLRKLAATEFAKHLAPQDLMHVMGWSNMGTAYLYLQEAKDDEIQNKIGAVI